MERFDVSQWPRKKTYELFKDYADPTFNLTTNVEVTRLYKDCVENKRSFFLSSYYYLLKAANEVTEFRLRIIDDEIWDIGNLDGASIVSRGNGDISFIYFQNQPTFEEFMEDASRRLHVHLQQDGHDPESFRRNLILHSVLPWVSFTSVKHPHKDLKDADMPRITNGKLIKDKNRIWMPTNVEAHHGLMDGYQMSRFFDKLETYCAR
ncbi:CatA-like O-acetyltransferase [Coprobacter tertius]|uniref:CatA-like O-acetyltransferase n=1 Tax=Coprobacter tertius TaxID=2944915 RepID=A0ABT1MDH1_9BACT|nr:CatA-like O-acetyltransferase [Coprobacter tertius]MCP9610675.1 CatA-like O-acetyltransferase [Coprobacter tertius]